jgi:hypothetical protein
MKYPIEKYNIVIHQHPEYHGVEIIAWSTYAGKAVYGKAICRNGDTYSEETGKRLAIARCAAKIARKRLKRADKLSLEANRACIDAKRHLDKMNHYYEDARNEVIETEVAVDNILKELG